MRENKTTSERAYGPSASKGFRAALEHLMRTEFPRMGGSKVRDLFVEEIIALIDSHHMTKDRVGMGQVLWYAVAREDHPYIYKRLSQCKMVPVILTLVSPEDIAILREGKELRRPRIKRIAARLYKEAFAQGGVLSAADVGLLIGYSPTYVNELIHDYEEEHQVMLPTRGSVHDMGSRVTHKAEICRKSLVEGKQTPDIARETFHDERSVDRYLQDFDRVFHAMFKHGMSVKETCFTTRFSEGLVRQYMKLAQELGLSGEGSEAEGSHS
jgi:hypothetical protein